MRVLFLAICFFIFKESTAQIREFYSNSVNSTILLCKNEKGQLIPYGTAFIYYNYLLPEDNILVTCEHLTYHDTLIALIPANDSIKKELLKTRTTKINFSSKTGMQSIEFDGNNFLFTIPLKLNYNFFKHQYLDLAVIFCTLPSTLDHSSKSVLLTNVKSLPISVLGTKEQIYAGQEIAFIGFPYGIGTPIGYYGMQTYSDLKTNPVIRKGIVSWTSENSPLLLVDGFSYGGNSGSPIFSIPNIEYQGKFIGMVFGHLTDDFEINDLIIDTTKKTITPNKKNLEINNGLAKCIPAYIISEFVNDALSKRKNTTTYLIK